MRLSNVVTITCFFIFSLIEWVFNVSDSLGLYGYVVFCCFFLLLPITYLFGHIYLINKSVKSRNWPYVQGKIDSTEYNPSTFGDTFNISYSYYVNDRHHNANNFSYTKEDIRMSDLFSVITLKHKSYSELEGTALRVYYDPSNAWNAIISNKVSVDFTGLMLPSFNALFVSFYLFYKVMV
jgi:hypothetical protein